MINSKTKKNLLATILIFSSPLLWGGARGEAFAQFNLKDSTVNGFLFSTNYSYNFPGGNVAKRFGDNSSVGGSILYKFGKNWMLGIDGNFLFGGKVKEDSLFKNLQNGNGDIIGEDGLPLIINLFERGFFFGGKVGKAIPIFGCNPNSGLFFSLTGGILQHKIRIEVRGGDAPQLSKKYKKGYDRLSNGFAMAQYIGFLNLDKSKLLNFHIGIEVIEAFTKNRRDLNFDTAEKDAKQHLDLFFGIKAGWILPVYNKRKGDLTYYN